MTRFGSLARHFNAGQIGALRQRQPIEQPHRCPLRVRPLVATVVGWEGSGRYTVPKADALGAGTAARQQCSQGRQLNARQCPTEEDSGGLMHQTGRERVSGRKAVVGIHPAATAY